MFTAIKHNQFMHLVLDGEGVISKERIVRLLVCVILLVVSAFSKADCGGEDCSGVTIDRIYLVPSAALLRFSTTGDESKLDCNANGDKYITLEMGLDYSKEAYALILAAHQAQSTFWVKTTGADTVCEVVYLVSDK